MRKTTKLSKILGLTQSDVAMLMGITRSHWTMFESGQRKLPPQANLLLSAILNHLKISDNQAFENKQQEIIQNQYKKWQPENKFKLLELEKKIEFTQRKLNSELAQQKLIDFVETCQNKDLPFAPVKEYLSQRKKTATIAELTELRTKQQHQRELLEFEMKLIASKLKT